MREVFYVNNNMSFTLEGAIREVNTFEQFQERFPDEFLSDDAQIGNYLEELMYKYDKDAATISHLAGLDRSYVGNIMHRRKNNPGRDALIGICLAIGTTIDEVQHLLKYAGHAPLYVRRKRDVIIWFGFMKGKSVAEVDDDLFANGYKTFGKPN